jgi:hypothetical protein
LPVNDTELNKSILAILFLFSICSKIFAADSTLLFKKRNALFVEAGGKGPYYSVNYERIFKEGKKLIYFWRAGFSLLANDLSVPLSIGAFTTGSCNHFEFSLGLTPYLKDYKTFLHNPDLSDKQIYVTPGIGYRFQKANDDFFFSAGIDPLIFMDPPSDNFWNFALEFKPTAHIAFGFLF